MAPTQKIPPEWHDCLRALNKGGITQPVLAEALGVSHSRVTQIVNFYDNIRCEDGKYRVRRVPLQAKGD